MFNVALLRNKEQQDVIEVMVLRPQDERFFKRNGIQIDMEDHTYDVVLTAKLQDGSTVQEAKAGKSMTDLFAALAERCRKEVNTLAYGMH
jgi:hypothetical protein